MTFYQRYLNGETTKVYEDIYALGQDAFSPTHFADIKNVLRETFERVAYNLDIIYAALKNINYLFATKFEYNFQRPLVKPLPNTEKLLLQLDKAVEPFGFVPLSLKMFYQIVGACNFAWDYKTNEDYFWPFADPIQICSLDDTVATIITADAVEMMEEYYEELGYVWIDLAADYLHKDNVSGGPAYAIKVTAQKSIDAEFLNEEHNTTFINYLRICFEGCGFSRLAEFELNHQEFFDRVQPLLKPI